MNEQASNIGVATVTISSSKAAGEGVDLCTPALANFVATLPGTLLEQRLISDDRQLIERTLYELANKPGCDLILTSGGTGFSPDDVTPEATLEVIERQAPGIAEAIRQQSREHTKHWMLSRAVAGIYRTTLIINFPGNPKSIQQAGSAIEPVLQHAVELLNR